MKLYRSEKHPGLWIGKDAQGGIVQWPAEPAGWAKRTPYGGPRRALEEVERNLARGTGWPGGVRGPKPRGGVPTRRLAIRVSVDEDEVWTEAAKPEPLSEWARRELNAAAVKKLGDAATRKLDRSR